MRLTRVEASKCRKVEGWKRRLRCAVLPLFLCAVGAGPVAAQNTNLLGPRESSAKAHELIQRAITALGGESYLKARDMYCEGRFAQFSSQGQLSGYERVYDDTMFPDKNRTEFSKKRNIAYVYNGDHGWSLDRGGVEDLPADAGEEYLEGLKTDIHILFRFRMNEEGMTFRYGGRDMVDLKPADWVEVMDRERRIIKIAFAQSTGLPIRAEYITRDKETRVRTEETEYYSNYHTMDGVETSLRIWKERNGRMVWQVFWDTCRYNTGVDESYFSREALEMKWAKIKK